MVNCKHIEKIKQEEYATLTIDGLAEEEKENSCLNTKEAELKINCEGDACAKCGEGKGEIPLCNEDGTSWVCEKCDSEMFNVNTDLIIQEIDKQISFHKEEHNIPAINSLKYIKSVVEKA